MTYTIAFTVASLLAAIALIWIFARRRRPGTTAPAPVAPPPPPLGAQPVEAA